MKTGRYNLEQLFTSPEIGQIVIPELQRDYVWENRNVYGFLSSIICNYKKKTSLELSITKEDGSFVDEDIHEFLNIEYMRLRYNTRVGFIYAYHDITLPGQYYLIDGQQRITTLFLILLALYRKVDTDVFREKYFRDRNPKLDYKVRDTAHNFLTGFIEFELNKQSDAEYFIDSAYYFSEYEADVTAQSILNNYYDVICPMVNSLNYVDFIDYVETYVEFNYFDTNISEQGERLYLYMNSRGEALSDHEIIKSIIVSRTKNEDKLAAGKLWEDWQNFFWKNRGNNPNADISFFEFLKWSVILHMNHPDPRENCILNTDFRDGKAKSTREIKEDYIRIETSEGKIESQRRNIKQYISDNLNFDIDWLKQVMSSVKVLNDFSSKSNYITPTWLNHIQYTKDYVCLLGVLQSLILFDTLTENDVLRLGMFLKNIMANLNNRKNPDSSVLRALELVPWMYKQEIKDIRKYKDAKEEYKGNDTFLPNDMRLEYYELDEKQNSTGEIGEWEKCFWKITNNEPLNQFLRGNHNPIIKLIKMSDKSRDTVFELFNEKIYKRRDLDELRKELLKYGDISQDDGGGTNNIPGGVWIQRLNLLTRDQDENSWNTFLQEDKNIKIIYRYLHNIQTDEQDLKLKNLADSLEYMGKKKYLRYNSPNQKERYVLLANHQAARTGACEIQVMMLYKKLKENEQFHPWRWEHNYCVNNFKINENYEPITIKERDKGYFIDICYDWSSNGGKWYCNIGHKEYDRLPSLLANEVNRKNIHNGGWQLVGTNKNMRIIYSTPIYIEDIKESFDDTVKNILKWFFDFWDGLKMLDWSIIEHEREQDLN